MLSIQAIIFDLDGTLIDSSASILASYRAAFERTGRVPVRELGASIIGPPLGPTLQMLSGSSDAEVLDALACAFIDEYDSTGYRHTVAFDGVDAFLRELTADGVALFIATNKRIAPTRLIVEHLGWADLFDGVYALDSWGTRLPAKEEVIRRIVGLHALQPAASLYVGDREEDRLAAQQAGVPFFMVPWGYGGTVVDPADGASAGWSQLRRRLGRA